MKDPEERVKAYDEAKKRVENEKGFYIHLVTYIILNVAIYFFKEKILLFINADSSDKDLFHWWGLSNILTPLLWGIGLFFHWLWAFDKTPMFSKKWEEKKIKKLMDEDDF